MTDNIKYNGVDEDKQRLAYLKKNGVQVYGATVTGPVRELEKLKEESEFWDSVWAASRYGIGVKAGRLC